MKRLILSNFSLCVTLILQAQVSKTINLTTAGNLSTYLTSTEKNTVTDLIVKGKIDARDVKFMRDSMNVLANLDLEEVIVDSYSGISGPYGTYTTFYPANEMPACSFSPPYYKAKTTLKNIKLPLSLISIGDYAFCSCDSLYALTIPKQIDSIKIRALAFCTSLDSVFIPSSVKYIDKESFSGSSGFFKVESGNPNFYSENGVLFNKLITKLLFLPTSLTGDYIIPSTVVSIEYGSIWGSKLTSVTIPASVNYIADTTFLGCENLNSIVLHAKTPPSVSEFWYWNINKNIEIHVPYATLDIYKNTPGWKNFTNFIEESGFSLSKTNVNLSTNQSITVYSNTNWTVVSNQPWLTISTNPLLKSNLKSTSTINQNIEVTGNAILNFIAEPNNTGISRNAIVTISSTESNSQDINITQDIETGTEISYLNIWWSLTLSESLW